MLKVKIKDFMGCASAEIEANKIALLLGHNGQGKTSALLPIASALRGSTPLGLQKTKAGMLVKIGSGSASIVLENETSKVSVSWPKCERRSEGADAPEGSDIAIGSVKFPLLNDKEKVELLRGILKCEPTRDNLCDTLAEAGIGLKVRQIIWHNVETEGWDASLDRAKEKGRSLKSQWALIAGEAYGEKKGANWYPTGWENDLEGASAETLEAEVSTSRAELEFKIANQAVGEDELLRLKEQAVTLDACIESLDNTEKEVKLAEAAIKEANTERKKLPDLPKYDLVCPHCGNPVAYQFGKLETVNQTLSSEDREALEQKILDADNAISKATRELSKLQHNRSLDQENKKNAELAASKYNNKKDLNISCEEVDKSRNDVRKAEARLSAFNKYNEAFRVHNGIVENQAIINVLEPDGIRRQALEQGLDNFNDELESLCRIAGWNSVSIDGDMSVNYSGRPYVLCSESEKFRAVVTLQVAIASYDGSHAVVIDAADILDNKGRSGFLKLLSKQDYCSFVGMMVAKHDAVPDLNKLGIGKKYWVESGKCEEVYNG